MLIVPPGVKVLLVLDHTDMRKGMDQLAMLVQEVLKKAGFYNDMQKKSGDKAWALLEKYVGPLA